MSALTIQHLAIKAALWLLVINHHLTVLNWKRGACSHVLHGPSYPLGNQSRKTFLCLSACEGPCPGEGAGVLRLSPSPPLLPLPLLLLFQLRKGAQVLKKQGREEHIVFGLPFPS
ncbi:unnamed protein product [Rangifer tarandus platyrhynchus]|uniref:Uncharacterized protein n=1 Tax=Rangifer tarandus platyrhynchus TaxID=3082113 RepID=A0AC59ZN73_RANTA